MESNYEARRPYMKPEATLISIRPEENIAASGRPDRVLDDEFDGDADVLSHD